MLRRFIANRFSIAILATVVMASLLPSRGQVAVAFDGLKDVAIALLFFLHGAKLSREAVIKGITHWRLHLVVLLSTFALFPLLGLLLRPLAWGLLTSELYAGVLLLCALPSTVQSSVAFTALGRGNVPAAVTAASASSLVGIVLTPLLVGLLLGGRGGGVSLSVVGEIVLLLLVPFVLGQVLQRPLGPWVRRHPKLVGLVDQGSILLVVYTAFSASVVEGLWGELPPWRLVALTLVCALLLGLALLITRGAARALAFGREDEVAIVFCGSKKSLVAGAPMASVLFAGQSLGALILPLLIFHQLQLMVCAVLAQGYARRDSEPGPP